LGGSAKRFLIWFVPFQRRVARISIINALAQLVLKLTSPGVPDFYQGSERWDFSPVDPDNRHPVDFATLQALLDSVSRSWLASKQGAHGTDLNHPA
jgi:maltooligosyltrehalose synthase